MVVAILEYPFILTTGKKGYPFVHKRHDKVEHTTPDFWTTLAPMDESVVQFETLLDVFERVDGRLDLQVPGW
jgi:hypothetical protein